ncbi:10561_t:CDS:2 [Dentiscutata heterogama]|uniref:10561_t:CDS:1 n=1 Tax=Dentiscutata heterogama TaxID=1316150 RepID=A0ACA9KS50_9GLOM|nr:10561_t:CDS:2 [Dentiscutata heterogama]
MLIFIPYSADHSTSGIIHSTGKIQVSTQHYNDKDIKSFSKKENKITTLDEATELDEVTELDEDIEIDNTGTYEASKDEENKYYADENESVNHLVESQEINILKNNLENINLGEDNEEDSDLE